MPVSVTSPGWCVKAVIHFEVRTDLGGSISFGYCIPLNRCTQNRRVKETPSFCPWSFAPHRLTRTRRGLCCCWCQYGLVPWFLLPTPQPSLAVVSRPSLSRSKNGNLLIILVVSPAFEAELSTHTTPRETTASCLIGDCVAVLRLPCTRLLNSEWWGAWLSSRSSIFIGQWFWNCLYLFIGCGHVGVRQCCQSIRSLLRQVLIPSVIGERREKNLLRQAQLLEDTFGSGGCIYPP